ncbi:lysine-rich coiled-coil protein 1-like [Diceros bicornis minor]|uniref:lysine-rich coiled-coil protein 1-like n=1 Tax=Diceros bicornis minor TaxID=77932 RepID=UPI0026EED107|nr:lysine-rich coiled-coil protein 1-like [Diceros bicornis minor]
MAHDSFQHELEDYIRKQKARGLQPELCFRKVTEDSACREQGHAAPRPLMLEQSLFRSSHRFPSSYQRLRTVESQSPPWSKIHHSRRRLESLNHSQKNHDHFFKNPWFPSPPVQGKTTGPHAAQCREDTSHLSEEPTRVHQARDHDRSQRRRSRKEGGGRQGEEEQVERKRKHRADSHKENRRKAQVEPGGAETPKYSKKSRQDRATTKEGRRSNREKKQPGQESPQERDLWDEAILGSCY